MVATGSALVNVCTRAHAAIENNPNAIFGVHVAIGHNQYNKHISTIGQCIIMQIEVFERFLRSCALLVTCSYTCILTREIVHTSVS